MSVDENTILETFYEHFKDTCSLCKDMQRQRNKQFVLLCALEVISVFFIYNPDFVCEVLSDTISMELKTTIQLGNSIVQSLVWILIAYILFRYVQADLYIERQYGYIESLEKRISSLLLEREDEKLFNRESDAYLSDYPMVLNLIHLFYKTICPILFVAINVAQIMIEIERSELGPLLICDIVFSAMIVIVTLFYFFHTHEKLSKRICRNSVISKIVGKARKILREV